MSDATSAPQDSSATNNDEAGHLKQELEKAKNDFLYLRAEFDNYRKQVIKERSDMSKYGSERLIVELLNVLDNFDRARQVKLTADNLDSFKSGMEMCAAEFKKVLGQFGVTEMDSKGKPFDPNMHEALGSEESDLPPGSITQVYKSAYRLHERVIRPAQVMVAKEKTSK